MIWLRINTTPSVGFCIAPADRSGLDADIQLARLISIGTLRAALSIPGISSAETSNISVVLENSDGKISALFADAPIRASAKILSDSEVIYSGVVTGIDLDGQAAIHIEAGAINPLSDVVPLRTSTVWGDFTRADVLPIVYGRAELTAIRYDARAYLVADHAIAGVDSVSVDGESVSNWTHKNTNDTTGATVALIMFSAPIDDDQVVTATIRGKLHPVTGALLDTPAGVLWDLLANVYGIPIQSTALDAFSAETTGMAVGGVINDLSRTRRAQIDEVMMSIGAAWSLGADDIAMLFPPTDTGEKPSAAIITPVSATNVSASTDRDSLANKLRAEYLYSWAEETSRAAFETSRLSSINQYGLVAATISAPWTRTERQAAEIAERLIEYRNLPRWRIGADIQGIDIKPGDWVDVQHPIAPYSGRRLVVSAETNFNSMTTTIVVI